jgi:hypothetical protein
VGDVPTPVWWWLGPEHKPGVCACCLERLKIGEAMFRDSRSPSGRLYGICRDCLIEIERALARKEPHPHG